MRLEVLRRPVMLIACPWHTHSLAQYRTLHTHTAHTLHMHTYTAHTHCTRTLHGLYRTHGIIRCLSTPHTAPAHSTDWYPLPQYSTLHGLVPAYAT
eukprot:2395680-Rhodomonas_salina.5